MVMLRDYQKDAVFEGLEALTKKASCLIVAPTGSGKTEIMMEMLKHLLPSNILVVTKRVNLVDQTRTRFKEYGLSPTVYCSSLNETKISALTIASVDSIHSVINEARFKYVVFDEVHNLSEDPDSRFNKVISHLVVNGSKLIGFTATPYRAKSGSIYGEQKFFDKIDYQIEFEDLINQNYLVKPILKNAQHEFDTSRLSTMMGDYNESEVSALVNNQTLGYSQVDEALLKTKDRKKIFWQCANIKHAVMVKDLIEQKTNTRVSIVHSKEKNNDLRDFENDESIRHCVFVTILSEGYNYPKADALVLLRPTKSPVLYVQTVGRILRPFESKKDALVLDFGQVIRNCGPINSPVLMNAQDRSKAVDTLESKIWLCKTCLTYNEVTLSSCMDCGAPKPVVEKKIVLTSTHERDAQILWAKAEPSRRKVNKVVASHYLSKAGNPCYKLSYYLEMVSMFEKNVIDEYFASDYEWAVNKAKDRFRSLGIDFVSFKSNPHNLVASNPPQDVEFIYEGKYPKIKKVIFREGNRA